MAHSASDVARWILNHNNVMMTIEDADYISNLKLQKLLYYAQGCFLAFGEGKLFDDEIVAWDHGPVVETVYYEYRSNGGKGIESFSACNELYTQKEESILKMVYESFAQYSAWALRNMTHNEDPWKETERNKVIDTNSIKVYFEKNYVEED